MSNNDWEIRFKSLVQELDGLLKSRRLWTGNKQDRDGARLIQAFGLALHQSTKGSIMLDQNQLSTIAGILSQAIKDHDKEKIEDLLASVSSYEEYERKVDSQSNYKEQITNLLSVIEREIKKSPKDQIQEAERVLRAEYYSHIRSIAREVFEEIANSKISTSDALEEWIHESLDGDSWVFQTYSAQKVLLLSNNDDVYVEEFGTEGLVTDGGINYSAMAFETMKRDLWEDLELFGKDLHEWIDDDENRTTDAKVALAEMDKYR